MKEAITPKNQTNPSRAAIMKMQNKPKYGRRQDAARQLPNLYLAGLAVKNRAVPGKTKPISPDFNQKSRVAQKQTQLRRKGNLPTGHFLTKRTQTSLKS